MKKNYPQFSLLYEHTYKKKYLGKKRKNIQRLKTEITLTNNLLSILFNLFFAFSFLFHLIENENSLKSLQTR